MTELHSRPTILVSTVPEPNADNEPHLTELIQQLADGVVQAIEAAGGRVSRVAGASPAEIAAAVAECDGVVLLGGGDINPDEYGAQDRHPLLYNIDSETDAADLELVRQAEERQVPILAICRGMHIVNVAHGGTLIQHLEVTSVDHRGHGDEPMVDHEVSLSASSELATAFGKQTLMIRSGHHQAVDLVGAGLMTTARASDGTVEALESIDPDIPLLAIQWHPEEAHANSGDRALLFRWLTDRAKEYRRWRQGNDKQEPSSAVPEFS